MIILMAGVLSLSARTWTSADDSKQLEGEFKYFDTEKGEVAIEVKGELVKFDLDKLSQDDQDFVKAQGEEARTIDVAGLLSKAKVHQLGDGKFKEVPFEAKPDYYLVYFSASW